MSANTAIEPGFSTILSLEKINELLLEAGTGLVATASEFVQITVDDKAEYSITVGGVSSPIFIVEDALYQPSIYDINIKAPLEE